MKKNIKKLILISLGLVIILVFIFIIVFFKKAKPGPLGAPADSTINSSTPNEIVDPTIMTAEERKSLQVDPALDIEVIRRSATGAPTDYRIIR